MPELYEVAKVICLIHSFCFQHPVQ